MKTITIRNEYGHEFEVDASARPFWEKRPGVVILDNQPSEPDADPAPASPAAGAASDQPDVSGASSSPLRGSKKG
ncbi:hypothetical protein ACFOY2_05380 [Nonomuraea purpurea]|uniref:Uncharacterized protein n=1 Tax=Nonomuraea purpurea TaxID=1849276 RepID=A0ABV8G2P5_9ACTN